MTTRVQANEVPPVLRWSSEREEAAQLQSRSFAPSARQGFHLVMIVRIRKMMASRCCNNGVWLQQRRRYISSKSQFPGLHFLTLHLVCIGGSLMYRFCIWLMFDVFDAESEQTLRNLVLGSPSRLPESRPVASSSKNEHCRLKKYYFLLQGLNTSILYYFTQNPKILI